MSSPPSAPELPRRRRAPAPDGETLIVDGLPVHFMRWGSGPPLVLLHGASGNLRDWSFGAAEAFAASYSVIAFDRPGLGFSALPRGGGRLAAQAARLRATLALLGVERATLVGHSFGGAVALAWALDAPESIDGLLLIGAPSQPWRGRLGLTTELLANGLTGPAVARGVPGRMANRLAAAAVARIFAPEPPPEGYLARLRPELLFAPGALRGNARQLTALKPQLAAMAPRYGTLALPVEILHGSADAVVPVGLHAETLAGQIPRARLTRLEGVGHMPHHTALPEVLAALERLATAATTLRDATAAPI